MRENERIKMPSKIKTILILAALAAIMINTSCTLKVSGFEIVSLQEKSWRTVCIYDDVDSRPKHWATPLKRTGLPNLFKVSEILYRGGQPKEEGFRALKQMGIKTIVDLRVKSRHVELIKSLGFKYIHISMTASRPKKETFKKYLDAVGDPENHPIFVHCHHGADRTGAAVALYRIKIEHWKPEDAITEMVLGCSHFHRKFAKILPRFVREFSKKNDD